MDVVTQGLVGGAAAQAVCGRRLGRLALPVGFGAGILADADYAIRFAEDPIYVTVYHRGFTHALLFIPIGGLIAMLPFLLVPALRRQWKALYLAATAAYATHGPIDTLTAYGTRLFWPLSDARVSLDWISVTDLVFGLVLLVAVIWSAVSRRPRAARAGLALGAIYVAFCAFQSHRVEEAQERLAASRGHEIARGREVATVGNALLWRSVYLDEEGVMHADAIRVPLFGGATYRPGESLPAFEPDPDRVATARRPDRLARDLARYRWFTDGFWARTPGRPEVIGDMRITRDPAGFQPLWGLELHPEEEIPARHLRLEWSLEWTPFLREVAGADDRHRPIPAANQRTATYSR